VSTSVEEAAPSPEDPSTVAHPSATARARAPGQQVLALLRSVRGLASRPSVRPWLLGTTALVFVILAVTSFRSLPDEGRDPRPVLLAVLVLVTTPATLVLNALEYRFMASTLDHRVGMRSALRVSLVASVANYLPAPGGVAVRTAALRRRGSTIRSAFSVNVIAGLVWAGLTGIVAGGALLIAAELRTRALGATLIGLGLVVTGLVLMRRRGPGWGPSAIGLVAIELATVVVSGVRLWVAFAAIGQTASIGAAVAMSSSTVLAALVGVFPAGLGLRELLAGGIAATVDVTPAAAVAATAVDRLAGQVGLALAAVATGIRWGDLRGSRPDTSPAG
jgi:hypothetical protein